MTTRMAAIVIGIVFIAVGVLGFIPNPLISATGLFAANSMHNLVHIVSGLVLLAGAYTGLGSALALKIIGAVYGLVTILGLIVGPGMLLGIVHINAADNWLHVFLTIVILGAGFLLPEEKMATA